MNDNNTDDMGLERLHDADERAYEELIGLIETVQQQISMKTSMSYIEDTLSIVEKLHNGMNQVGGLVIQHHSMMKPCITIHGIQSIQQLSNKLFSPLIIHNHDVRSLLNNGIHAYEIITETGFYSALTGELDIADETRKRLYLLQRHLLHNGSKTDVMDSISEKYRKSLVSNVVRMNDDLLHGLAYEYASEILNYEVSICINDFLDEIESQEPQVGK